MATKELILVDCTCGTKPAIIEMVGTMTKTTMYVYKCPKCGQTGEMYWPRAEDEVVIKSWNHTIKTKINHVKYKS